MLELKYKPYLIDNGACEEPYFLTTPNNLISAVRDTVLYYGLVLELSDALELELYKSDAIHELKTVINSISVENPTIFKNLNGNFNIDLLPAIEPVDQKTQVYNVIIEDISNIIVIQENNRKNLEKYF